MSYRLELVTHDPAPIFLDTVNGCVPPKLARAIPFFARAFAAPHPPSIFSVDSKNPLFPAVRRVPPKPRGSPWTKNDKSRF